MMMSIMKMCSTSLMTDNAPNADVQAPLFLGIRLQDMSNSYTIDMLMEVLEPIYNKFNDTDVRNDVEQIAMTKNKYPSWNFPKEPHITSFYVGGGPPTPDQQKTIDAFVEDVDVELNFKIIAYIPGQLIAAPAFFDRQRFNVDNRFPHLTLAGKDMAAVYSNNLPASLYDDNPTDAAAYDKQFVDGKPNMELYNVTIEGKQYKCYVSYRPFSKIARTRKFYQA